MSSTDPTSTPAPEENQPETAPPVAPQTAATDPAEVAEEVVVDDADDDDLDDDLLLGDEAFVAGPGLAVRVGAEAAGSFVLVLGVLGVALYSGISGVGALGAALAGGLALAAAIATFGHVSGGHFIPVITLASAVAGRTSWVDVLPYWLAQVIGAVTAAAVMFLTVPTELPGLLGSESVRAFVGTAANTWGTESSLWAASGEATAFDVRSAFLVELVAAAVLAAVMLSSAVRRTGRSASPLAAGAAFAVLAMVAAPVTGGSLNPARSTAAALFAESAALGQLWLFWVAPLVGAAVAGLIHRALADPADDVVVEEVVLVER